MANNAIQHIQEICTALAQESLTADDLAQQLGSIQDSPDANLTVAPHAAEFAAIRVMKQYQSDDVNYVDITLAESLPFDDVVSAFGEYRKTPPMPKKPPIAQFPVDTGAPTHTTMILVPANGKEITSLKIRRDIRL